LLRCGARAGRPRPPRAVPRSRRRSNGPAASQFTNAAAAYFAEHDAESTVYYVNRLTGLARVIIVSMGALGTGITGIASVGQAALAVQVRRGDRGMIT